MVLRPWGLPDIRQLHLRVPERRAAIHLHRLPGMAGVEGIPQAPLPVRVATEEPRATRAVDLEVQGPEAMPVVHLRVIQVDQGADQERLDILQVRGTKRLGATLADRRQDQDMEDRPRRVPVVVTDPREGHPEEAPDTQGPRGKERPVVSEDPPAARLVDLGIPAEARQGASLEGLVARADILEAPAGDRVVFLPPVVILGLRGQGIRVPVREATAAVRELRRLILRGLEGTRLEHLGRIRRALPRFPRTRPPVPRQRCRTGTEAWSTT